MSPSRLFFVFCALFCILANALQVSQSTDIETRSPNMIDTIKDTNWTQDNDLEHLELRDSEYAFHERNLPIDEVRAHIAAHLESVAEPQYEALNRRFIAALIRGAAQVIMKVVEVVKNLINKDKAARGEFTKHVVDEGRKQKPKMNWVACHTKHRTKWKGTKGKDWNHMHQEFDVSFHKTVGYEIYWAREGEFWNQGDGGYLNWAYNGKYSKDPKDSKHIIFHKN